MIRKFALVALLVVSAISAKASCTAQGSSPVILIPSVGDSGNVWAPCLQYDFKVLQASAAFSGASISFSSVAITGDFFSVGGSTVYVHGGKVGIRQTAPVEIFETNGNLHVGQQSSGQAVIRTALHDPANPVYSFWANSGDGVTDIANGIVGISGGGVLGLSVSASSVTAPVGIFAVGTSTFVVKGGNVAIGTASPTARLQVGSAAGFSTLVLSAADSSDITLDVDGTSSFRGLYVRGSSANSNILGNLQVGGSGSPGAKLDVQGNSLLSGKVTFGNGAGSGAVAELGGNSGLTSIASGSTTTFTLSGSGFAAGLVVIYNNNTGGQCTISVNGGNNTITILSDTSAVCVTTPTNGKIYLAYNGSTSVLSIGNTNYASGVNASVTAFMSAP